MIINHNMAAMNTHRQLGSNNAAAANNIEKLSSGLKINRAGDDAAGLAISEKMRGQIRGLDMAQKNSQDAISLIQTAEGALNETHDILQRMRELAVQGSNDTNTASDRKEIQKEMNQLTSEVDRIANNTEFNTKGLLNGSSGAKTNAGANITGLNSTAETKSGTLNLTANGTMATKAVAEMTMTAGATTAAADGKLDITANGKTYNIEFKAGQKLEDIAKNISSTVDGYTAKFEGTKLTVTSNDANADQSITIAEGANKQLDAAIDNTTQTGTGGNASGLTGDNGAAFSYQGNKVTVTDGAFKGVSFELQADDAGGATSSVNGKSITISDSMTFHIGANEGQNINLNINAMDSQNLGVSQVDVTTQQGADSSITKINKAIEQVSAERSKLGATQNRLEHTINNLGTSSENLTAAESRIRDVDYVLAA